MKIAAYVQLARTGDPTTGVGKHVINMVHGLAEAGHDVRVMAPGCELDADGQIPTRSRLRGMPVAPLPFNRFIMERAWLLGGFPRADRFTGDVDWIYSPDETFIPAGRSRFAATVHCVNWFDPLVPWYGSPRIIRERRRMGFKWRKTLRRADVVLTVSDFLKRRITELFGTDPARIVVVGNGVEQPYFDVAQRDAATLKRATDRPYIIVIGGLVKRKGAACVLEVAESLARIKSDVAIVVVGNS
ncbi:MAG: glycosyltransferase family 4 protein, partial [Phycisphaerae bacterium]|nr:glycosyltransferase family 4 protein [Phycisphaerae bacterium]